MAKTTMCKFTLCNSHRSAATVIVRLVRGERHVATLGDFVMPPFSQRDGATPMRGGDSIVVKSKPAGVVTLHFADELENLAKQGRPGGRRE